MIHQALYNLYPNITSIVDEEDSLKIFEGSKEITDTIDMAEVEAQAAILAQDLKIAKYRAEVGRHIDQQAHALGFDSIITAVTYADEPADSRNQSYGQALREWRSKCWEKCREALATSEGGGAEPTVEELIASLPAFVAP